MYEGRNTEQIEKHIRIKIFNFVLTPVENQHPERYSQLLRQIWENRIEIKTYSDRFTQIKTLYGFGTDLIHGEFVNYVKLNPDLPAYNKETGELENMAYDPSIGPNAKLANYYFIPSAHRLVVHSPMKFSENHILTFLENAFPQVVAEGEAVIVNIEKSREAIERIMNADQVVKLYIRISYSNNDNNDYWAELINEQLQRSHVNEAITTYKPESRGNITIEDSSLIKGQLDLSLSNGNVEASIIENGKPGKVNTLLHPRVEHVTYIDDLATSIRNRILRIFRVVPEDN